MTSHASLSEIKVYDVKYNIPIRIIILQTYRGFTKPMIANAVIPKDSTVVHTTNGKLISNRIKFLRIRRMKYQANYRLDSFAKIDNIIPNVIYEVDINVSGFSFLLDYEQVKSNLKIAQSLLQNYYFIK